MSLFTVLTPSPDHEVSLLVGKKLLESAWVHSQKSWICTRDISGLYLFCFLLFVCLFIYFAAGGLSTIAYAVIIPVVIAAIVIILGVPLAIIANDLCHCSFKKWFVVCICSFKNNNNNNKPDRLLRKKWTNVS